MANLKETKRRISSVKSTQKITRAMKLVSSAKFARANASLLGARPYSDALRKTVAKALQVSSIQSPLFQADSEESKILLVVVSTDRGLCGPLNTNLFRHTEAFVREKQASSCKISFSWWGKKATLFGKKKKEEALDSLEKVIEKPSLAFAEEKAKNFENYLSSGKFDSVYIAYSSFRNAMSQPPCIKKVLPITMADSTSSFKEGSSVVLLEPEKELLIPRLIHRLCASHVFRVLLEASASEHAARMAAMDSATSNADEVIKGLTMEYNRARQASITKELIEITSGAEALHN